MGTVEEAYSEGVKAAKEEVIVCRIVRWKHSLKSNPYSRYVPKHLKQKYKKLAAAWHNGFYDTRKQP